MVLIKYMHKERDRNKTKAKQQSTIDRMWHECAYDIDCNVRFNVCVYGSIYCVESYMPKKVDQFRIDFHTNTRHICRTDKCGFIFTANIIKLIDKTKNDRTTTKWMPQTIYERTHHFYVLSIAIRYLQIKMIREKKTNVSSNFDFLWFYTCDVAIFVQCDLSLFKYIVECRPAATRVILCIGSE